MYVINTDHLSQRREDAAKAVQQAEDAAAQAKALRDLLDIEQQLLAAD